MRWIVPLTQGIRLHTAAIGHESLDKGIDKVMGMKLVTETVNVSLLIVMTIISNCGSKCMANKLLKMGTCLYLVCLYSIRPFDYVCKYGLRPLVTLQSTLSV